MPLKSMPDRQVYLCLDAFMRTNFYALFSLIFGTEAFCRPGGLSICTVEHPGGGQLV